MTRKEYDCGHSNPVPYFWDKERREQVIKWRYSVGNDGSREMCYECWLNSNMIEIGIKVK